MHSIVIIIVRYFLAVVMIIYGTVKITRIQFQIPDDVQAIPLKDLDGLTLTFAFLGYSKWLAIASGVVEAGAAIMLLFWRTYLLGAIILFPVLTYVFLVNIGYDFSLFMRIWTGALLILDIILLVINRATLKNIFLTIINPSIKNLNR